MSKECKMVKHFVGYVAAPLLMRGMHDVPVFRTAQIAHQHTGEETVYQVDVTWTGGINVTNAESIVRLAFEANNN